MNVSELLTEERTLQASPASCKKQLFEELATLFAKDQDLVRLEIFDAFLSREKLGPTTLGHGVALPHIRSNLVSKPLAALIHLGTPLDFAADDGQPVDLIIALIVPVDDPNAHLEILAHLVSLLRHESYRNALRQSQNHQELYLAALTHEFDHA